MAGSVSKGEPAHSTRSASLPTSMEPTRSSMPACLAGLMVMAWRAAKGSMPCLMARPAHRGKYSWGITGASVMMDTCKPAFARMPGVSKVLFRSSNLLALVREGPTAQGTFSLASSSAIRWPSVTCSKVIFTFSSLAMRRAVKISSAAWAWAFRGISRLMTGIRASIFRSKAGFLLASSPAASFFSRYSRALYRVSRSLAAVVMRVDTPLS